MPARQWTVAAPSAGVVAQANAAWEAFARVARGGEAETPPVGLIVDSPWLPGYAGVDHLDYFLKPDLWLQINLGLLERFPGVVWLPGFWVEYGMAAEPSAFGARITWHHNQPPSLLPVPGGLAALAGMPPADPQAQGLMPLILRRYVMAEEALAPSGLGVRMVAARGPLAVAGFLLGLSELMVALKTEPEAIGALLEVLTQTTIDWLRAQLAVLGRPEGILLLDDIPGMLSPRLFDRYAGPYMARIFDAFAGMIRIYHNDTPCAHLLERLAGLPFEVWNCSHTLDLGEARAAMPGKVLLGNVPPLDVLVRGTGAEIAAWVQHERHTAGDKGLVVSAGGGVSPGTLPAAIDALREAAACPS